MCGDRRELRALCQHGPAFVANPDGVSSSIGGRVATVRIQGGEVDRRCMPN
jgi:hypothetical protein